MTSPESLKQALNRLGTLPPIPHIARRILALKIATDEGERELLDLIEKDPPILSKIVGLANSPLFGSGRRILRLQDAAALLGSKRVKMIALSFAMMSAMARKPAGNFDVQGLWQHCLCVAMAMDAVARAMPKERHPSDDAIYLAGLSHDIGFLVLDYLDPALSDQFHARLRNERGSTVDTLEAEMLEMSHGELGARLGRQWNLPEAIIAVLHYHHSPADERAAPGQPLVALIGLAEKLLPAFGIAEPVPQEIAGEEWQALGIDPLKSGEIKAGVLAQSEELAAALGG